MPPKPVNTPDPETTVPPAFTRVFYRLVRRCQIAGGRLDPQTCAEYWSALRDVPLEALTDSAEELARTQVFFPAVAEWRHAARVVPMPEVRACAQCGGYGVIHVAYHSGEPFDIALCNCAGGQAYRRAGEALVRARLQLGAEHRVADLEAFDEDDA